MLLCPFRRFSVSVWEQIVRSLRTVRLDTMRGKFVLFAVLATLFATLAMTVMLYEGNRRSLNDRVALELRALSSDGAREMGGWFDQRLYDLRLRASPYVVSDNLARTTGRGAVPRPAPRLPQFHPPESFGPRRPRHRRTRRPGTDEQRQPDRFSTIGRP